MAPPQTTPDADDENEVAHRVVDALTQTIHWQLLVVRHLKVSAKPDEIISGTYLTSLARLWTHRSTHGGSGELGIQRLETKEMV